jgi:uncharacterized membrane protein YfcA
LPITSAAAISLVTVIATSSTVTAGRAGAQLINVRLGMVLEVATAAGSVLGGVTAQLLSTGFLQRLFGVVTALIAGLTLTRLDRRNVIDDPSIDPGLLGGRFVDDDTGRPVVYRVKRLPLALVASFAAGNVSSLLGVGGGVVKVPLLTAWCGVPLRAAAATSALMIGVTATGGALIYYGNGQLNPAMAAAAVLGVQLGSFVGLRFSARAPVRALKLLLVVLLGLISVLMLTQATR